MFEARNGSRGPLTTAFVVAFSLSVTGFAGAKPTAGTKDAEASRIEQKALRAYVAGDLTTAIRTLERALHMCEPSKSCTSQTRAHLHISLGTVRGVGEGDYRIAKNEFTVALSLDPDARLRALATPALTAAFEEARNLAAPAKPAVPETPPEKPPEKAPEKPASVTDLLRQEENAPRPPPPPPKTAVPLPPPDVGPPPRWNWLSVRTLFDFAYMADANICSPGAPSNYFCSDESGARYTGRPQANNAISRGFAFSTARLVLGYERLFFGGFTAGAFAGYSFGFAPSADGRPRALPIHLEARASYAFGNAPYADSGDRFNPFVFLSLGVAGIDTHVIIRVNEIPCGLGGDLPCKRDLNAYRTVGNVFTTLGGGVRMRLEGRHALRAAMRATIVVGDAAFVFSPELVYELGI